MKFKFSRTKDYVPEWNGNRELPEEDQVKAVIRPMEIGDLLAMMDAIGASAANELEAKTQEDYFKIIKEFADIIPKYVTITGLSDEDGEVSTSDLTRFAAYMPLATELAMYAVNISMPTVATEGNSGAPPA